MVDTRRGEVTRRVVTIPDGGDVVVRVVDQETREPLPVAVTEKIYTECVARGLLLMAYGPRVRINPPLILTEAEADKAKEAERLVIEAEAGAFARWGVHVGDVIEVRDER